MPKRKILRTPEEEAEYQHLKKLRHAESQKKYKEKQKKFLSAMNDNTEASTSSLNLNVRSYEKHVTKDETSSTLNSVLNSGIANNDKTLPSCSNLKIPILKNTVPSPFLLKTVYGAKKIMKQGITSATLKSQIIQSKKEISTNSDDLHNDSTSKEQECLTLNSKSETISEAVTKNESEIDSIKIQETTISNNFKLNIKNELTQKEKSNKYKNYLANMKGYVNLDHSDTSEHYIGPMDILCQHCNARHFKAEKVSRKGNSFNDCCNHGKVQLDPLPPSPDILEQLFSGNHSKSNHFYERIRSYNNSFSFASFNANLISLNNQRRGPYCFKIQGQIYYQINTALYPESQSQANFGQLFILDSNEATECRLNGNSTLDTELLYLLDNVIRHNNVFAQSYQMMHDEIKNQEKAGEKMPNMTMGFITKKNGVDRGRYNIQKVNEVAAIFSTNADGDIPDTYVTIKNKHDKSLKYVSTMDPNVEPWIYPLFYPFGTQGWYDGIKQTNKSKRVTRSMYIQHRIAVRDEVNNILRGRRLFQQWIVDNYVKVEKDRLNWCKENQKQLRIENYKGLMDHLETSASNSNANIGRVIILPSTFIGSPRNMMLNYQDSMAIVRKYGKPDLFITMTCNPNWREIKENLFPGQQPADRPDICARVFDVKKNYLIDLIVRQKFFGEVEAFVYVVEFQKRGLPHIHMLVTLKRNCKIMTPEDVDKFVCAEIPDPNIDKNLHDIVIKNMIHGPCGQWCVVNGKCSKHYPKPFQSETTIDGSGYPQYCRRDTGVIYEKHPGFQFDNRYVVPYCPKLSAIFNSHINVEIVSSIKSVKYLYKYIFKGHDAASVIIEENSTNKIITHDEVKDFVDARYVGPVEACWRILGKSLQDKSHSITRLPVHLPKENNIVIRDDFDEDDIRSALNRNTMLLDFLDLNKRDNDARKYCYSDIPLHYVFKKVIVDGISTYRWEKRKSHFNCIGRMYSVSPGQQELYHLRILLLHVKGATSFEDLRTVNGKIHPTFTAACLALGLIDDDDEWRRAMEEGTEWMMPKKLRLLFARILMHCQPVHPYELWTKFKIQMSEDYIKRFGQTTGIRKGYAMINQLLNKEGWDFSLIPEMDQVTAEFFEEDQVQIQQESLIGQNQYELLNIKQKEIVDYILNIVKYDNSTQSRCLYIDGPGGSGKTFIYTTLYYLLKSANKFVHTMAFTGIAATLLPNGRTVHKTLGLPVPLFDDSTSNIKIQSKEAEYLKNVDVFIWDEAPMAPRYALEVMDQLLKELMQNDLPFGGKIIILGGDYRQLLPVLKGGTRSETVNLSIKYSRMWKYFHIFSLTDNMRAMSEEKEFAEFLLDLGNGTLNDNQDNVSIPIQCIRDSNANIAKDIYGEVILNHQYKKLANYAILSARNIDVDEINQQVVELLDETTEKIYLSIDSVETTGDDKDINQSILPEYLYTLNPVGLPPHELRLRKYTVVMLIRNLSISEGLCNGTRLLILELGKNLLKCQILNGDKAGDIIFLHRVILYCENVYPFTFKRRQFPIRIAFAMTINKSQGQTFDKIGIDLRKDVFNHGQLYVAFSRVRSYGALNVYQDQQKEKLNKCKNYVYKEIFS